MNYLKNAYDTSSPVPGHRSRRNFRVDESTLLNTIKGCVGNVKNLVRPHHMVTAPINALIFKNGGFLKIGELIGSVTIR